MSLVKNGMSWLKPLTVDSKLLPTLWMSCQLPTWCVHQKDARSESERGVLDSKAFVQCLMFLPSYGQQPRTIKSFMLWLGLLGGFLAPSLLPVAFNLCLLQKPRVGCFQHGGFCNPISTDALDPVILFSWTFLCITGYWQHPWCLPTHQRPIMYT